MRKMNQGLIPNKPLAVVQIHYIQQERIFEKWENYCTFFLVEIVVVWSLEHKEPALKSPILTEAPQYIIKDIIN